MFGEATLRRLAHRALQHATAPETEVALTYAVDALTRFSRNSLHQNVAEADLTLEVRAVVDTQTGAVTTNDLSEAGIERAVRQATLLAEHMARRAPARDDWPGLPAPHPLPSVRAFDEDVARITPEHRAAQAAELCAAAEAAGLLAAGSVSAGRYEYALANSHGLWAYAPSTHIEVTCVTEAPSGLSAYTHAAGWRLDQVDAERLTHEALRAAHAHQRPVHRVPPGVYPVVLEPYAVLNLLEALIDDGLGALAVQEERSWMTPLLGQPALSPFITLVDDALDPDGLPRAFDCEGMPKQPVMLIERGVPRSPVYDRITAAREPGRTSTGHAQPYLDDDWDGPLPENLRLEAGPHTVAEMIASLDQGLYINRFWYVRPTGAPLAAITGTTRDGVWWVERGELAYPVRNLRFDQELVSALRYVRGLGNMLYTMAGFYGIHRAPALALEAFRFVG